MAPLALPEASSWPPYVRSGTGGSPEDGPALTLAQSINATLAELMDRHPELLVFGEDVAVKGGVYGVTRGLRGRFGVHRVFDTLLDEQTILGAALGSALAGLRAGPRDPVPRLPPQRRGPAAR